MPNWCTNRLNVTGDAALISAFKARFVVPDADDELAFDFERIIPMPPALLEAEHLQEAESGLAALNRIDIPGVERVRAIQLRYAERDGITEEDLLVYLVQKYPGCLDKADDATRLFDATGHISWYPWAVANWGTKWNSHAYHESCDATNESESCSIRRGRLPCRFMKRSPASCPTSPWNLPGSLSDRPIARVIRREASQRHVARQRSRAAAHKVSRPPTILTDSYSDDLWCRKNRDRDWSDDED